MSANLLEQLGNHDVPRPPVKLRQQVRERVNHTLIVVQVLDLAFRGLPYVLWHFAQAVGGWLALTLTGTYEPRVKNDARRD